MRVTIVTCDWKERIDPQALNEAMKGVGNETFHYDFDQDSVDAKIVFISNERLSREQMEQLFDAGDLYLSYAVWEGTFEEILQQLEDYLYEQEEEA